MYFSKSEVDHFWKFIENAKDDRRLGQRFYDYFQLDKIKSQNHIFCNKIYNATDDVVKELIKSVTDNHQ